MNRKIYSSFVFVFVTFLLTCFYPKQVLADAACGTQTCPTGNESGYYDFTCMGVNSDGYCYDDGGVAITGHCQLFNNGTQCKVDYGIIPGAGCTTTYPVNGICSQNFAARIGGGCCPACPAFAACPTACGTAASNPPNGSCGTHSCAATASCSTEPTPIPTPTPTPHYGNHDGSTCTHSNGWACSGDVIADIKLYDGPRQQDDSNLIGRGNANSTRSDPNFVSNSGCNSTDHGFEINYNAPLTSGTHYIYAVYVNNGNTNLPNTPKTVDCTAPTVTPTPTPTPSLSTCSITIIPGSVVSGTVGSTIVTYTGTVSPAAPPQNVRLFLERRDSQQIPVGLEWLGMPSLSTSDAGGVSEVDGGNGKYYYEVARCAAGSGGSCNEAPTIAAPPGQYYFHCDVASAPGACSGNPFCSYENLGGTIDCSSGHTPPDWVSCSTTDNGTFDVNAPPTCSGATFPSCITPGTSFTVTANGVNNATQVRFPTWSSANGQDDIVWYTDNGAPWEMSIAQSSHPGGNINVHVYMDNNSSTDVWCDGKDIPLCVIDPWWQVKDGDVTTNGDLNSVVPSSKFFEMPGGGGYPGIPGYWGSANTELLSNISQNHNWIAKSYYASTKIYDSNYFLSAIPTDIVPTQITPSSEPGSYFTSGGTADTHGYYWYEYDGTGEFNISSAITAASMGSRKVILIVKNANLNIDGDINLTKGSGFFFAVSGKNISVNPTVASLAGIFVADEKFLTGTSATQLLVRGTIAAYGGIDLKRDLAAANLTTPAEVFEFAPDLELLFPNVLGARLQNWQEVAP